MAAGGKVTGLREVQQVLGDLAPREAKNLLRSTVHGIAGRVRDKMKETVPKHTRNLEKAIKSQRRRGTSEQIQSDVIITQGKHEAHDGFYWRFVEYGTRMGFKGTHAVVSGRRRKVYRTHPGTSAQPFVAPSIEAVRANINAIYLEEFGKRLERLLARKAKRAGAA